MYTTSTNPGSARLRQQMVAKIRKWEEISEPTAAAMLAVERHLFTSDASLEHAYDPVDSVVTRRDAEGVAISSASAPTLVAGMLDQLDVREGHHVLEIGAGTGYNAALLSELVGETGSVTTIDIDPDVVTDAHSNLALAGVTGVNVFLGDGEYGHVANAPYDRIIVTAGAWNIPDAWAKQLKPGGLLVVPLRIKGVTRSIAFARRDRGWVSRSDFECGFMPIRGDGEMPERNVALGDALVVRIDDGGHADADALTDAIRHPGHTVWTGVETVDGGVDNLDFFLADLDSFCRVIAMPDREDASLAEPVYAWGSRGVATKDSIAYVTKRRALASEAWELGACAYGPDAARLATLVAERITDWDQGRAELAKLRFEVHPAGGGDTTDSLFVVDKGHTRIIVRAK